MTLRKFAGLGALLSLVMPSLAMAADEVAAPVLNSGDTAWMLTSTALVLFMTIPGLALFYGGMVRSKNILSVMMQCFAITGLISILWVIYGYSIAFDTTGMEQGVVNFNSFFGGMGKAFLAGVTPASLTGPAALFPEAVFITFQMTFAIITPALIVGAFAERMKFSAMLIFMGIWFTLVYAPIAHMVWSGNGGLMWDWGVLDFAGGTVVHINAGVAGLMACLVLGKRKGFPTTPMAPHNLGYTLMGAGDAVGRLVRLQRRFRCGGQRHRRHGHAGHPDRDRCCGTGLDVRRVDHSRQAKRPGHRFGCGRRSGRHHPGRRHRGPDGRTGDRSGGRRGVLLLRHHPETQTRL